NACDAYKAAALFARGFDCGQPSCGTRANCASSTATRTRRTSLAKSQWSFQTATSLSAALAAKKISAVELTKDAIARIERHDKKINAICVRDIELGLKAAREADAALARGEKKT